MKKIMIALAAVALATGVQAAAMDWKVNTGTASTYAGLSIYMCTVGSGFESVADIEAKLMGTEGNTGSVVKNGSMNAWYGDGQTIKGLDDGLEGNQSVYAVIVSADGKGYWSIAGSGEVYTTATTPATANIDASTALAGDYTPFKTEPPPGPTPGGIPEPTSGLLLVLGGAILALRRRRA